jgi:hypothetical protein
MGISGAKRWTTPMRLLVRLDVDHYPGPRELNAGGSLAGNESSEL